METGGCRMGGAGPGAITLEELDGLEESPDSAYHSHGSSLEEEAAERMDDEEQERLLSYWQSVGRGHQVDVPRDMAEPIQQLTRNNNPQERQTIPFTLIQRKEKLGDLLYEKRQYGKAKWACIKMKEKQYEQSICLGFMKLMRSFRGITNEDSIMREISVLAAILESPELCLQDTFIIAGYTNPAAANRHNEIWFLQRP
ncbi:hypothetical protein BTVI_80918 [Pitangus sulphuratus]|nr:hypothetical protein BTVI_80918 [Pitangus sulphuratus]